MKTMITFFEIAIKLGYEAIGNDLSISGITEPLAATTEDLVFIFQKNILKNRDKIRSKAWIIDKKIMDAELTDFLNRHKISYIASVDIYESFVAIIEFFYPSNKWAPSVHPTSIIHLSAQCASDIHLGPHCSIGENSCIENGVVIMENVVIGRNVTIGSHSQIYPNVTIYDHTTIGKNVIIHAGTVIGSDGFGFYKKDGRHHKIPHTGKVIIEDDVEIGANCVIDRGTLGETRIKRGTKLDNLIQVAHNVIVGEDTLIAAQTGIAGSTVIGDRVTIAGQAGIVGHITIGNDVTIGAQSGVISSIEAGKTISGYPARDHAESLRKEAYIQKIPEILKQLKQKP
jgi:UDP-3-O-[3-hydroxymyristoyl] glucosamine N-acyltransferase